jgi:hypothetical protein
VVWTRSRGGRSARIPSAWTVEMRARGYASLGRHDKIEFGVDPRMEAYFGTALEWLERGRLAAVTALVVDIQHHEMETASE